ncbi:MAG: PucR family transcriptional regulator, partial [Eggerthella lenta]
MITVADILALPAFEQVQPLVLCEGAESREVHNVGILDCAPDKDGGYESYIPGEFIVTNLGFAHDDPELSERSLLVLIARGVSGIALKKAYRPIVSDRVRAASEAAGVPMYLYDGGYHEVVAYQALDLIRRDSEQSDKGRIMDGLLSGHDPHAARAALYELAGATGSTVQCIAASPKADDECSLYAMLDAMTVVLAEFKRDWDDVVEAVFAFRYHGALLALVSYAQPPAGVRTRSESDLTMRLLAAGQVHLGVGEETPLSDGDMSVREALAALKTAQVEGDRVVCWADLHHDAFRAAAN